MNNNRIAALRKELRLNQKELGDKLGVGQTTVSAWETGKNEPDGASLNKMAKLFICSIGYLMGYENSSTRGLSREEYDKETWKKHEEREEEKFRKEIENNSTEEQEIIIQHELEELEKEWENSGPPDTIEGFKISKMIDELPQELRKEYVSIFERLLNIHK